jgi:hypothetical protein
MKATMTSNHNTPHHQQFKATARCGMALALALLVGSAAAAEPHRQGDFDDDLGDRAVLRVRAASLPSFAQTPNIAAAAGAALGAAPVVRALYGTESGEQIYRCDRDAAGRPAWALRTPLAHLTPKALTALLVRPAFSRYHARSDFGSLVSDAELSAMGLLSAAGVRVNAPIWQFTFTGARVPGTSLAPAVRRETVAGRVLAQDTVDATAIPWLLIQVRGRAVTTLQGGLAQQTVAVADPRANPIAASEYLLRFNTLGGVAPAAALCVDSTLGAESAQPYAADYYFVDIDPPQN